MARTRSIPTPRSLPRQRRTDLAAKWRLCALPPRQGHGHGHGHSRSPPPFPSSASGGECTNEPKTKKSRSRLSNVDDAAPRVSATAVAAATEVAIPLTASDAPHIQLPVSIPLDLLAMVLEDVASLCPRTAFGCRHVSRHWREAATGRAVQRAIWVRCVGEWPPGAEGDVADNDDDGSSRNDDRSGSKDRDSLETDVVDALVRVERFIVEARYHDPRGYPYTDGDPGLQWLEDRFLQQVEEDAESDEILDDGAAVRCCADRRWWRAAETLVSKCGAVDHRVSTPELGRLPTTNGPHIRRGTREDAILDLAVDAGDSGLCRALLCCNHTAVSMQKAFTDLPVCRFGFGHSGHARGHLWHSVEAVRSGHVDLAAMLVTSKQDGGGGQLATPLMNAFCCGDLPWTPTTRPAMDAAVLGVQRHYESLRGMLQQTSHRFHVRFAQAELGELRVLLSRCHSSLPRVSDPNARSELKAILDRCSLPSPTDGDDSEGSE